MKLVAYALVLCLSVPIADLAVAQSTSTADQRAKLANQRIQVEADQKAKEEKAKEEERLEKEATDRESVTNATPKTDRAVDRSDLYRVLEQLRELGELKDAGYLSDEEFQELKEAIIASTR